MVTTRRAAARERGEEGPRKRYKEEDVDEELGQEGTRIFLWGVGTRLF